MTEVLGLYKSIFFNLAHLDKRVEQNFFLNYSLLKEILNTIIINPQETPHLFVLLSCP